MIANRVKELRTVRAGDLLADARNWRRHPQAQRDAVQTVLDSVGYADAVIAREENGNLVLIDGHLRAGLDPNQLIPVLVTDLNAEEAGAVLATLDPLAAMAQTDSGALQVLVDTLAPTLDEAMREMLDAMHGITRHIPPGDPDELPEVGGESLSKPGDVWQLGKHRVMCGDATVEGHVARLLNGAEIQAIVTDPPYSSGGFQEAGKSRGSKGTDVAYRPIVNDILSTRGYQALIRQVLANVRSAKVLYMFTDWRMWLNTFDIAEAAGFGVRAMIVWDKKTPGMGMGWRHQHELILCGAKTAGLWRRHMGAQGDVINMARVQNELHATQKPVELMEVLLKTTPFAKHVLDPFMGSGSTIIAAERLGLASYGMDLDPLYVDTTVLRWEQFTGEKAVKDE